MCDMKSLPALTFLRTGQEWGCGWLGASPAQTEARVWPAYWHLEANAVSISLPAFEALGGGPHTGTWRRTQ